MKLKPSPVSVDGALYVCIAMFLAIQSCFTSEEAYKYVNAYTIFWIKSICGIVGAGAGALKMFRSTTYSDFLKEQKDSTEQEPPAAPVIAPKPNEPAAQKQ